MIFLSFNFDKTLWEKVFNVFSVYRLFTLKNEAFFDLVVCVVSVLSVSIAVYDSLCSYFLFFNFNRTHLEKVFYVFSVYGLFT